MYAIQNNDRNLLDSTSDRFYSGLYVRWGFCSPT